VPNVCCSDDLALAAMCAPGLAAPNDAAGDRAKRRAVEWPSCCHGRVEMGLNVAGFRNEDVGSDPA